MRRIRYDLICVGLLMLAPLLLFAPVALGTKTLLPVDILYQSEPFRSATGADVAGPQNALLGDLILQNYPWKLFIQRALSERELPLWDPYLFAGHPFLANGQHSAWYPLTWLFFVMPATRAFGVFIAIQLGLAGVSMYVMMRTFRSSRLGALLAGLVFQFSGFLVASVVHPMIVAGAAWLPLLLALMDLTLRRAPFLRKKEAMLPWALAGAAILGLQILAGHAEITYFVLLVMAGFAAWRLIYRLATLPRAQWRYEVISPTVGLCILVLVGLGLGAIQLGPFYEVAGASFRQETASLSDVLGWAYPKRHLIAFLIPNFFGNPTHDSLRDLFTGQIVQAISNAYGDPISVFEWGTKNYVEGAVYVGILPLLLALVAILRPPKPAEADGPHSSGAPEAMRRAPVSRLRAWLLQPYVPFLTALAGLSLACMFGTPLYAVVYALPFLEQSHSPFRWVFPFTVALAALAGFGVTSIEQGRTTAQGTAPGKAGSQTGRRLLRIVLLGGKPDVVGVIAALGLWSGAALLAGLWISRAVAFRQVEPLIERAFWSLALAARAFPDHRAFYSYLFPWVQATALLLIGSGVVLRLAQCRLAIRLRGRQMAIWKASAILIVLIDLLGFGAGFNPAVDPSLLDTVPAVISGFLQQDTSLWRFSTFDPHGRGTLPMNSGMIYGLQDVRGYDSQFSAQYARYMSWIEPQNGLLYNQITPFTQFSSLDSPLTDLLSVKYILTEEEIPLPKYKLVYHDEAVRVYENLGAMPRAFTLPATSTLEVPDADSVGEAILSYDPRFYTIIESDPEGWTGPQLPSPSAAGEAVAGAPATQPVTSYTSNEVSIDVTVSEPAWLILTDAYYPGWKAFVRPLGSSQDAETEVSIARVAGNFRGVHLEGSATVRFKYSPNSVKLSAFVSFLAGMTLLFLGMLWLWRRTYREAEDDSTVRRLAKNSLAPMALTLFNRIIEFAFAALMLRILGPANAGDYTFAISIFVWFDILTNFGLNTYLTREVARRREDARRYLINTTVLRLALSMVGVPLLVGFIGLRQGPIAALSQPASRQAIVALLLLYVGLIPNSISTGLTALFYAFEKAEYPAAVTTITTLLRVAIQTLVLLTGWGIVGLAGSAILINLITLTILLALAMRLVPEIRGRAGERIPLRAPAARSLRRAMVSESWPLMVNHLLATLFFKIDIFLMESILGSTALGLYSIGYKILDAAMFVPAMFTMALFPLISRQAQSDQERSRRFYTLGLKILVTLVLPVAMLSTLAAREIVLVLAGPEYLPGAMVALQLIVWSMPISWVNGLTQYMLIALNEQRYLTRAYLIGFGFTLISNLVLMPRLGYETSAALHAFSELVLFIPFIVGIQRTMKGIRWGQILGKPALAALGAGAVAVALLSVNRAAALASVLVIYPLLVWRLQLLAPDERAALGPMLRRG